MRPQRVKNTLARDVSDEETVVVALDAGRALVLNATGSAILDLCNGTRTVEEIADFICENTAGAGADDVQGDVAALVAKLIDAGVVEDPDPCGPPPSEP